jgi:hypothetical protein
METAFKPDEGESISIKRILHRIAGVEYKLPAGIRKEGITK